MGQIKGREDLQIAEGGTPMSKTPQKKNGSDMTRDPCFRLQHASRISKKQTAKYFVGKIFEKCIFLNMVIVVVIEIGHL